MKKEKQKKAFYKAKPAFTPIGILIQESRHKRQISITQLAEHLGIPASSANAFERLEKHVPWKLLPQISEILEIPFPVLAETNMQSSYLYREYEKIMNTYLDARLQ
jgi:transcriptional regulator with XRE-family HTH domain